MAHHGFDQDVQQYAQGYGQSWSHKDSTVTRNPVEETHPTEHPQGQDTPLASYDSHAFQRSGSVVEDAEHVYPGSSSWVAPFTSSRGYEPVSATHNSMLNHMNSFDGRAQGVFVEDESYDMSLLKSAAPFGSSSAYTAVDEQESAEPMYDMTSFSGPMGTQDLEFLKQLQEQEASGKLTRGLGAGMNPDTRINSEALLAISPTINRTFTLPRALSVRRGPTGRDADLRNLGQTQANKTGEVIEVIMEEPSDIDLSNITGTEAVDTEQQQRRRSTLPDIASKTKVFYPQPNWRPFTMRWPYLISLILVSLGLAIAQEVLYQNSRVKPLMKFRSPDEINPIDYFVLKFLPTIVTVLYGVLWSITDVEVKRLEAFYQMSKEGGALAAESINVDYLTDFNLMRPFRAFQRRHYAVVVSSVATLLAISLIPTLGSAAIVMHPSRETRQASPNVLKTVTIHPVLSRILTSTFLVVAVLGIFLALQLGRRRTGLLADVKGMAGLASMAVVSHIMTDFKDMDVAKPKDIHYKLRNYRYVLRNSSLAPDESSPTTSQERNRYKEIHLSENPHPLMLRALGGIPFIISIFLFLGFIPIFLFTPASELTDRAPWVVTALAVSIKLSWSSLETSVRMMEPYYILSKRHAPAKTLTLDYTAMPFGWVAIRAALNKHWLVSLVCFGTVLSEILTVYATSLATIEGKDFINQIQRLQKSGGGGSGGSISGQETVRSFVISLVFTAFILLYMATVSSVVFARRRHPFLPRQPNTIASVLAFVHQSKMLYDFVGTAKFTNAQMVRRLEGLGKTYGLGWFEGRDGQTHCGVDEEELSGGYKHGVDLSQGNKPWDREWQLF